MKKVKLLMVMSMAILLLLAGCRKSERVSYNLSRQADDFNITRKITVINAIQGDVLYQVTGKMSIETSSDRLVIIALDENNDYKKHFIGLSDNVTYVVEDVTGVAGIDSQYQLIFNPDMVIPIDVKLAD